MMSWLVNGEGGLTTAGYVVSILAMVVCLGAGLALADRGGKERGFAPRQLAYCAMAVALAYVTSFIKLFKLPYGGSVTLMSMLFIVLVANWYGVKTGILVGFAYGLLQFLQEPYVLSVFQVCCDYVLAFAALGLAGLFRNKGKNGLLAGYITAVLARGFFHSLGGYLYWMDYMPENFPQSLAALYPIIYHYSYLLAEGLVTVVVLKVPAVERRWSVSAKARCGKNDPGRVLRPGLSLSVPFFAAAAAAAAAPAAAALAAKAGPQGKRQPDAETGQDQKLHTPLLIPSAMRRGTPGRRPPRLRRTG